MDINLETFANILAGDADHTFYCCGTCKGLWPIHRQLLKHKHLCTGDITLSDCDTFACQRSLYLKFLGIKNVETFEETIAPEVVPLQREACDVCSGMDLSDAAVRVKTELDASDVTSADVNITDEKRTAAERREMTPRRGRRRRIPRRWADEDVDVTSSHKRHSKKQGPGQPDLSNVKDISSKTIVNRGILSELPSKVHGCKANTDKTAESCMPDIKMVEVSSSNGQEQFGSSSDATVMTVSIEVGSLQQDKTADGDDDNLSDNQTGQNSHVGDLYEDKEKLLSHLSESEEDDDPMTDSQCETTQKQTTTTSHARHEQPSYDQYVVVETQQSSSGKISTQKYYKCPTCNWQTKHVGFFARHMRVSHDEGRAWTCDQCAFTCMSKNQMTKHKNQHTRPFLCQYCSVRYSEQRELERHIWKHKGEFPFCCSECDYKTRFSKALKEHVRKHTGEKLRCCEPGCNFATNYQYALSAHHAAKHAAEKRFACTVCAYRTSDKGSFTKHMKLHLGVKDYKCGECDYRAVTRYDIVKHMRRHTKEKLYFCDRCEYATSYSSGLRLHLMTHLGVKPWQCSLCGYNSVTRSKIVRHIRQRHADSPQGGSVIDLGLKLDMRARDYRQRARPPGQLAAVVTEDAPVEEVQYELLDIPLTMLEGAEVRVKTTSGDAVVDEHVQSDEPLQQPEDTEFVGAELTLITTTTTGV